MTIATIRFTAIGDIHNNIVNLDKIKTFMQDMVTQGKLDFATHSGDMVSSSANASQMQAIKARFDALGVRYYVATGNHDASGSNCYDNCSNSTPSPAASCIYKTVFGHNPDQYPNTTNFTKNGVTFQVLIPGMCWSGSAQWKYNFNDSSISKTAPSIVINHGPVLKPAGVNCGAWDSLHEYAFNMKPQLDALNMLAVYSGHVHAAGSQVINNRLYVVQDSVNSSRCSGTADKHRNIGYTRIDYDTSTNSATIRYQNMEYMNANNAVNTFVDPFPDQGPQILTSITVTPSSASIGIGSSTQLTATCKDQNNNVMTCPALIWSSTDPSKATVDSTGKVTGIAMGTTNVTAVSTTPSGSITSNVSTISVTSPPVLTSITLLPANVSINVNGTIQLTATCRDQNNNTMTCPVVTWSSTDSTKATVNSTGMVTGIAAGMANILATVGPITSNSSTITVTTTPGRITIVTPSTGLVYRVGESRVVRWTHTSGTGANVKIELLKAGILVKTISSSTANDDAFAWTIPSVSTGNDYQVRVTSTTTSDTGISGNFTIQGTSPVLTSITIAPANASININGTIQLTTTCKDQNNNTMTCPSLTWSSTDSTKATVNSSGLVTGISTGTTNITAKSGTITSNVSTITVTSPSVLASITIAPTTASIDINSTMQLTATCKDQNNNTMTCPSLTWSSSDSTKAIVNSSGLVTGMSTGTTDITAKSGSITSNISTITVTSPPILTSITIAPTSASVGINDTIQLVAICRDQNNNTMICPALIWSSTDSTKATVDSTGIVTGIAAGIANITAISGSIVSNMSTITVTSPVEKKFSIYNVIPENTTNNVGVLVTLDDAGTFTKDQACVEVCNRLGQI